MPKIHYKLLKERMSKTSKGFWKVQLIHKLTQKKSEKFNTKDFLLLKSIQKADQVLPSFINFTSEAQIKAKENSVKKKKFKEAIVLTDHNIFITNNNNKIRKNSSQRQKEQNMFINFYRDFPYEPNLYNEMQFIYLHGNPKFVPRKFKEVVKDCFEMDRYNKYLKTMENNFHNSNDTFRHKRSNTKNIMTQVDQKTRSENILENQKKCNNSSKEVFLNTNNNFFVDERSKTLYKEKEKGLTLPKINSKDSEKKVKNSETIL